MSVIRTPLARVRAGLLVALIAVSAGAQTTAKFLGEESREPAPSTNREPVGEQRKLPATPAPSASGDVPPAPGPDVPRPPPPAPPLPAEPAGALAPPIEPEPHAEPAEAELASPFQPPRSDDPLAVAPRGARPPPHRLPYRDGDPVPPGYRVESRIATGPVIAGSVLLGAGYIAGAAVAAGGGLGGSGPWMFVPVLGPLGAMAGRDLTCPDDSAQGPRTLDEAMRQMDAEGDCAEKIANEGRVLALLFVDGLVQMAGAATLLVGLFNGEQELVRTTDRSAWVGPVLSERELGVQVFGHF